MATGSNDQKRVLVELDPRRRVALGKVARPQDKRFLATIDRNGVITLTPVTLRLVDGTEAEAS